MRRRFRRASEVDAAYLAACQPAQVLKAAAPDTLEKQENAAPRHILERDNRSCLL